MTTSHGLLPGKSDIKTSARTALKKLCNHPKLIYDAMHARTAGGGDTGAGSGKSGGGGPDGFEVRAFAGARLCLCSKTVLLLVNTTCKGTWQALAGHSHRWLISTTATL